MDLNARKTGDRERIHNVQEAENSDRNLRSVLNFILNTGRLKYLKTELFQTYRQNNKVEVQHRTRLRGTRHNMYVYQTQRFVCNMHAYCRHMLTTERSAFYCVLTITGEWRTTLLSSCPRKGFWVAARALNISCLIVKEKQTSCTNNI
jgi:hypothetical protein